MHEARIERLYDYAFECHRRANQQTNSLLIDLWESLAQDNIQAVLRLTAFELDTKKKM
jgi:hypothetical protein